MIKGLFQIVGRLIKVMVEVIFTIALIGLCVFVDARYIEPKLLKVKEQRITTHKLTLEEPLKIVQFSDVHLGKDYSFTDFKRIITKMNALNPDLVIFTGDLIDDNKTFTEVEKVIELLKMVESTYGNYAVYGNHDHGGNGTRRYAKIMKESGFRLLVNENETITLKNGEKINVIGIDDIILSRPDFEARRYAKIMKESGFRLLVNENETITLKNGEKINVIGIDDIILSRPDFEAAFKGIETKGYKLFISHAPDVVDRLPGEGVVDLQLSGHSHGGQVRLPIVGAPFTVPYGRKYIKGLYEVSEREGMLLYVNSGIGTSQLPYRFLNPPEITLFLIESIRE